VADTVGSASPAVARVLLQSHDFLQAAILKRQIDQSRVVETLHACKEAVVVCEKVAARVASQVDELGAGILAKGIPRDKYGRALNPFPQVTDLPADSTAFLIHSKRAIQQLCRLPSMFLALPQEDNNFDALSKRLTTAIGANAPVTQFVLANASGVKHWIDLRNYQEHPGDKRTIIENFAVLPNGTIAPPTWCVSGDPPCPIRKDMLDGVDFLVEIAEAMLIHLVMHTIDDRYPFVVRQVPDAWIDPKKPIRYRLLLDVAKVKIETEP